MSLLALLAAATVQSYFPPVWAEFGRAGALSRRAERVEIATGAKRRTKAFPYRLRLTVKDGDMIVETKWADAGLCAPVEKVIHDMRHIAMPIPAPHGSPDASRTITMDGARYHLKSPSSYNMGTVEITSNVGTPLSHWVDAALKQLAPCWTDDPNG